MGTKKMNDKEIEQKLKDAFNLDYIEGYKKGYKEAIIETVDVVIREIKHILQMNDKYKDVCLDLFEDVFYICLRIITDNLKGEDMANAC